MNRRNVQVHRALILVAVIIVLAATPAGAHSDLSTSCPARGDVLNEVSSIELSFESEVVPSSAASINIAGNDGLDDLEVGPVHFIDALTVEATVLEPVPEGVYIVRYRIASIDGDEQDGGFEFRVDPDGSAQSAYCEGVANSSAGGISPVVVIGVSVAAALVLLMLWRRSTAQAR